MKIILTVLTIVFIAIYSNISASYTSDHITTETKPNSVVVENILVGIGEIVYEGDK